MLLPPVSRLLHRVAPALLLACSLSASQVVVTVHKTDDVKAARVSVAAVQVKDGGPAVERLFQVSTTSPTRIELPAAPGASWRLGVRTPGLWSDTVTVSVSDQPAAVRLEVLPASRIKGTVSGTGDSQKITDVGVGFTGEGPSPLIGHVQCPVNANGSWTCELPAGTLDLRLKSRGYMAQYRWSVNLPAGGEIDLGSFALKQGASVVGTVEIDERNTPLTATVRLQPQSTPNSGYHRMNSVQALALTATPNAKGFFAFDGVAPGSYIINATQKGFGTEPREVRVLANVESELSRPLRLMRLQGLLVTVSPGVDPSQKPWHIRLRPAEANVTPVEAAVNAVGTREFHNVPPGKYRLSVLASDGSSWAAQNVDVSPVTPPIVVQLDLVHVLGHVTLGEKPLAAKLWFGGEHGTLSVRMQSATDGTFEGDLPNPGVWPVQVQSEAPRVHTMLQKVAIKPVEGRADISLNLPGTALGGGVVSEDDAPIAKAIVTAKTDEETIQEFTADDGSFRFEGLPPGSVQLSAEASGTLLSESVQAKLDEKRPTEGVRIVLREAAFLRGRVTSSAGGVPGAVVYAYSLSDPAPMTSPTSCNESGDFRVRLTPGTTDAAILVTAAGFSFQAVRVAVGRGPVVVPVEQNGGKLDIDFEGQGGQPPLILKDGILIHFGILATWARATGGVVSATRLSLENMAPGNYSVCKAGLGSLSNCKAGVLTPLGELKIVAGR